MRKYDYIYAVNYITEYDNQSTMFIFMILF